MHRSFFFRVLGASLALALPANAHEGHDDAPGGAQAPAGVRVIVQVSREARANLGLEIVEATIRPMESTLAVIGEIAPLPNRAGAVTSRIAGRVTWMGVAEGDSVRKDELVVEVESLQLGDPPPRARYGAPLAGRVIDRHVVPGDSVEPNAHLLEVADLGELLAVGHLFEGQIGRVKIGQIARVRVPSYPDAVFEGVVERIGGALDPTTRSLPIYVRVGNPESLLLPNMGAELAVVVARADAALAVPRSALLGEPGSETIFVERDPEQGLFERVPVVRGIADDRFVEIVEGALPGDRVVGVGNYSLQFLPPYAETEAAGDAVPHDESGGEDAEPPAASMRLAWLAAGALILFCVGGGVMLGRRSRHGRA